VLTAVLTIAGSDSSGGAGIQADLKALAANGVHGACVVTAVTAQNSLAVEEVFDLPAAVVEAQLHAVFADIAVRAVKSGMFGSAGAAAAIADALDGRDLPYVLDPVMVSTTGRSLLPEEALRLAVDRLFPLATLITPNALEAARLTGLAVRDRHDAERAGAALLETGCAAVLVKGGHLEHGQGTDVLVTAAGATVFPADRQTNPNTHGTGCTLASAIAAQLAHGRPLADAVDSARAYVVRAIAAGSQLGAGAGPVDPFFFLRGLGPEPWAAARPETETIHA
jgi:hydroxymethylpyrimidine/phosphomethylpyrimidine kinase